MKRISKASVAIAIVASAVLSSGAIAEGDKAPGSGPNPFSDCGIGAALFPNTSWAAVTSNVIWDVGSTALTSATASPETCSGKKVQAAAFIFNTYDSLVEETAKGQGEHLAALFNILEADKDKRSALISGLREGMAAQVSLQGYDKLTQVEKASAYYELVNQTIDNSLI